MVMMPDQAGGARAHVSNDNDDDGGGGSLCHLA